MSYNYTSEENEDENYIVMMNLQNRFGIVS
jgi:hypothetical protein